MAANPLTYAELEAFERKALVRFSAWEADLLMRLDDAVLSIWAGQSKPKGGKAPAKNGEIPVDNPKAIGSLFRGIAARFKAKTAD
jgi:hypothetical protein